MVHEVPERDAELDDGVPEHDTSGATDCWCRPLFEDRDGVRYVVHRDPGPTFREVPD